MDSILRRPAPARRAHTHASGPRAPGHSVARQLHAGWLFVARRRRLRMVLVGGLLALALLAGGWLLLRDSSLVSVRHVQISGVHGPDAPAIEAALGSAARKMSTLDLHPASLLQAVAPFRVVRSVQANASFPHGVRIRVIEQLPVAALTVNGQRTAVAADGVVLGPALLSGSLPSVAGSPQQGTGQRLSSPSAIEALTVLGAAPPPLLKVVQRAYWGSEGLTMAMRNGLLAYFGDATRPHAKWLALARVLVAPSAAGASYVDVRLPERPAAGFNGSPPPEASAAAAEDGSTSAAASGSEIAANLAAALPGGAPSGSASAGGAPSGSASAGEAAASTPAQTAPEAPATGG